MKDNNTASLELIAKLNHNLEFYTSHLNLMRGNSDIIDSIRSHKAEDASDMELLNNFNSILLISILDMIVIGKSILRIGSEWDTGPEWDKIYYTKSYYLIIYETVNSLKKLDKAMLSLISRKHANQMAEYKRIMIELRDFKKANHFGKKIDDIRNKIAGHIEPDLKVYYNIVQGMSGVDANNAVASFFKILVAFISLCSVMATQGNKEREEEFIRVYHEAMEKFSDVFPNSSIV